VVVDQDGVAVVTFPEDVPFALPVAPTETAARATPPDATHRDAAMIGTSQKDSRDVLLGLDQDMDLPYLPTQDR
jgi:hypothetical protein